MLPILPNPSPPKMQVHTSFPLFHTSVIHLPIYLPSITSLSLPLIIHVCLLHQVQEGFTLGNLMRDPARAAPPIGVHRDPKLDSRGLGLPMLDSASESSCQQDWVPGQGVSDFSPAGFPNPKDVKFLQSLSPTCSPRAKPCLLLEKSITFVISGYSDRFSKT